MELKRLAQETEQIRGNLRYKIAGKAAIDAQLRNVSTQILQAETAVRSMRDALEQVAAWYERTENANVGRLAPDNSSSKEIASVISVPPDWLRSLKERYGPLISQVIPSAAYPVTGLLNVLFSDLKVSGEQGFGMVDAEVKRGGSVEWESDDFQKENLAPKGSGKYYYNPDTGKFTAVDENDPNAVKEFDEHNDKNRGIPVDVRLLSVGAETSVSLYGGKGSISNQHGGVSGSYDLDKFEANATFYAGLGGVGAEIGASATAFTAEGKAYLGDEDTQAYVKGKVTAGKLGGKADVQAGLYDKDGKFNPSAYMGASAEAIAGEISGSIGGKALGTDVSLEGSLNYGVGAHANVGIHDGKISVDVGATLGVGASVKLEIDVSGTIDAVHEKVSGAWSDVKSFLGW